jgi:leucyl aminopeptidase
MLLESFTNIWIMDANCPFALPSYSRVREHVLLRPYRPVRFSLVAQGLTSRFANTDAEGRLVLADALGEADEETPALLFCLATLPSRARPATGMNCQPFFTDYGDSSADLMRPWKTSHDPLWRRALGFPYEPRSNIPCQIELRA